MSVLIYQMGKVGSISVSSLLARNYIVPTHAHYLVNQNGEFYISWNSAIKRLIDKRNTTFKIISIVRDPIARNISAFTHQLSRQSYKSFPKYKPETLANLFINNYDHEIPLRWFDEEFNIMFDDVYSKRFYHKGKYLRMTSKEKLYDAVILRTENLGDCGKILKKVFGAEGEMLNKNSMAEKFWWYPDFKEYLRGRLPKELIDTMYDSKYVKHFYTDKEIEQFIKHWELT
jgi:hypothetical protein